MPQCEGGLNLGGTPEKWNSRGEVALDVSGGE